MKKSLIYTLLFVTLLLVLICVPTFCFAAEEVASGNCGTEGDNVKWVLDDEGTLIISGNGEMMKYSVGTAPWYSNRDHIGRIEIQNGVTTISYGAFWGCNKLTSIVIPDGITKIGEFAFSNCSKLKSIVIPTTVESIRYWAFFGTLDLKHILYMGTSTEWDTIFKDDIRLAEDTPITYNYKLGDIYHKYDENGTDCNICDQFRLVGCVGEALEFQIETTKPNIYTLTGVKADQATSKHVSTSSIVFGSYGRYIYGYEITFDSAGVYELAYVSAEGGDYLDFTAYISDHEAVNDAAVSPTCTEEGITAGSYCASCNKTLSGRKVIPAKGHKEIKHIGKLETCTEIGYADYVTCTECNYSTYTEIPARGHTLATVGGRVENCVRVGYDTYVICENCNYSTYVEIPAKGHSFSNGTCTVCGAADPNYIAPIPTPAMTGTTRIYGSNRYETAFKAADELKKLRGGKQFDSVIVACGTNFADALAGSYLAAVKDAPILLVNPSMVSKVTSYIKSNLKAGGTVYILGGTNAVPANMEAGLGGFAVKRFAGANRYETNLMILKEAGVGDKDILVATGTNFADSLSASATGKPILLVGTKLTSAQKQFLAGTKGTKYILGGTTAVSAGIENELKAYGTVKRLGGANRYATSVLIAETFFSSPKAAVLSYAQNFPDGLCGGVIAYKQGAPMLLVTNSGAKAADTYTAKCGIKAGYVLGGTGLISDATMNMIFS